MAKKNETTVWPAVLIGAGLTWLIVDGTRDRGMPRPSRDRVSEAGGQTSQPDRRRPRMMATSIQSVQGRVERLVRERPILAGLAAVGVGTVVSMAVPKSGT